LAASAIAPLRANAESLGSGDFSPLWSGQNASGCKDVLAVHVIRHVLAPRRTARRPDGALPRGRLRAVVEYIEGHLDASPTLEEMAAVARLSTYHFAHQFKRATGLPPCANEIPPLGLVPHETQLPGPGTGERVREKLTGGQEI
jgi:AraC-like DNA-binding protein